MMSLLAKVTLVSPKMPDVGSGSKGVSILSALHDDASWQVRGACRGPQASVFFPPSTFERKDEKVEREARAKGICNTCPVRQPCLDYAIQIREPHGIWGGMNENERKQILAST